MEHKILSKNIKQKMQKTHEHIAKRTDYKLNLRYFIKMYVTSNMTQTKKDHSRTEKDHFSKKRKN